MKDFQPDITRQGEQEGNEVIDGPKRKQDCDNVGDGHRKLHLDKNGLMDSKPCGDVSHHTRQTGHQIGK